LFRIIEKLVLWKNVNNEAVLEAARAEIMRSTGGNPPPVLDPFAGGGSIPLEAQRLGLEAYASDLNPVAVLINKALIEIPPKFAGQPPVNPRSRQQMMFDTEWRGAAGLAEDVRYYGEWMRNEAEKRIGHLYPKVELPEAYGGGEATVIAWLWARTVKCPNPACGAQMPLVKSFWLSKKKGKKTWVEPVVDYKQEPPMVHFEVKTGKGKPQDGTVERRGATCLCCETPVPFNHIRSEGQAGRMSAQLMAIVAAGNRRRIYLSPTAKDRVISTQARPDWKPEQELQGKCRVSVPLYGMNTFGDLFTDRQLVALTTFSDLVSEVRVQVQHDAVAAGLLDDDVPINEGGSGGLAYAEAVVTYLAFGMDKIAEASSNICTWSSSPKNELVVSTFRRQALPMTWDFAESNPFASSSGSFESVISFVSKVIKFFSTASQGYALQGNATTISQPTHLLISTDPPYYDNISYADLSDFFYVWLRHSLRNIYPKLFGTMLVPKAPELVATPYRFDGDKLKAKEFFEEGLQKVFERMRQIAHLDYPMTVYYAFKQAEMTIDGETASTGWETMLEGLIQAGFAITGTWPIRTERSARTRSIGSNALASSIVLVCRPRPEDAPMTTRRRFLRTLRRELPDALKELQRGNIAPVDVAQASIGPGMAIFSRYKRVLESDGSPLRVRAALALINETLDSYLNEQEGAFDGDTRWALAWFEQYGFENGPYGDAETLSKAKNTSVQGMVEAGILEAKAGQVRLLRRNEYAADWDASQDERLVVWEIAQQLIHHLQNKGELATARLMAQVGHQAEAAHDLAYRLYTICERKKWADEGIAYNSLVIAWPELTRLAHQQRENLSQAAFEW